MGKPLLRVHEGPDVTQAPATPDSRDLMIDHYDQHLQTATNRNGHRYSHRTIKGYLWCARLLAKWMDAREVPGSLTSACDPAMLNDYLGEYYEAHTHNGAAFQYRNLRTLFKWIERETGVLSPYRSDRLNNWADKGHKPKVLARSFIRELLASCSGRGFTDTRDLAIIRFLLEGLRVNELLAIKMADVPALYAPILEVSPSKGDLRYAQGRRIKLRESTVKATQAYLRKRIEHPLASTALRDTLWLGQASALPLTYDGIRLMLERRCTRLGYDSAASCQMFRHTVVSDLLEAGAHPNDVMEIMGWSSLAMLARYGRDQAEVRAMKSRDEIGDLY